VSTPGIVPKFDVFGDVPACVFTGRVLSAVDALVFEYGEKRFGLGLEGGSDPHGYVHNPTRWADPLGLSPCELGLRDEARRAIEKLENIKRDPLGEINRQPNHNHYSAARREASGEVVARKPDGTPYSHISDIQQARDSLKNNIIPALRREMGNPPSSLTSRGIDVLDTKYREAAQLLKRTEGFLTSIGHGEMTPPYHRFPPGA
jgi:hypothetical protein